MKFEDYLNHKNVFVYAFDDVIYPQKDYDLQVYYLFAEFVEYLEQKPAKPLLATMQQYYSDHGANGLFDYLVNKEGLDAKYLTNFNTLFETARLPLKLLMYQQTLHQLQQLVVDRKSIVLWLEGKPEIQVNKLKQLEWNNLETYLTTYFADEIQAHANEEALNFVLLQHGWNKTDVVFVGTTTQHQNLANNSGIEFLSILDSIT
ncbi:MAG: hypothetical protein EOO99_06200 [Pedobacter sp.]|nr:MAG: hypothetical protein EOO99_06200 [Pedobacter sp.]